MEDILRAKTLFETGEYTCVLVKGDTVYTSDLKGVAPLVKWLREGTEIRGFSAADKIIGKAAAMLFVSGGVREVYAPVMSRSAVDLFAKYGICASCDTVTPEIQNRAGTGRCPMEEAVAEVENPADALPVLERTLCRLREAGNRK